MDKEKLKKLIAEVIEMEHCSSSMEVCSPLYVARMLNVSLEEVEMCMKESGYNEG